jgi:hypothetical protein
VEKVMVDPKEIEQLKTDLDLVTKTSKVLASKLEKINEKVIKIMTTLESLEGDIGSTSDSPVIKPTPAIITPKVETPQQSTPAQKPTNTISFDGTGSKAGRFLDSFLRQIPEMTKAKDIATALSNLRDQVMQTEGVGFHPAFHEMGRYSDRLKNLREVTSEEREKLIEKIYDWKERIG